MESLGERLRHELRRVRGVRVHDKGARRCGIVTFTVDGLDATRVQATLRAAAINTSVSAVEYARFDLPHRDVPALVRASVHYYNTDEEIDRLVAAASRLT